MLLYHHKERWNIIKTNHLSDTRTISRMLCKCECGLEKEVDMISLKNNRSTKCKSCATKERKASENIK